MQKAVYLEENLFDELNHFVKSLNLSISDFIKQTIKKEKSKYQNVNILDYLDDLKPLESFKDIEACEFVDNIRGESRILR